MQKETKAKEVCEIFFFFFFNYERMITFAGRLEKYKTRL